MSAGITRRCSISAPVRGNVSLEAGIIGTGATGLGGIESSPSTAEGIMLVVGPRQVLGTLSAGDAFPVPGGQGDDPATAPGASPLRSSVIHGVAQIDRTRLSGCASRHWSGPRRYPSRGGAGPGLTSVPRPPGPRSGPRHRSGSRP